MCECSKRHLQRNGGLLTGVGTSVEAPAVNGYVKHVMRHHKGRGGGHCPPPPPATSKSTHAGRDCKQNVSFKIFYFFFSQYDREKSVNYLPFLFVSCGGTVVVFSLEPKFKSGRTLSLSVDSFVNESLTIKNKWITIPPGTGNP